eukprot:GHVS01083910.1.p1 GENE.GHVS01083910.1~~GHVS01083910.1.p1  ORF type:complete len:267 (-),score=30.31 GHVS01083910.1:121-921(-)
MDELQLDEHIRSSVLIPIFTVVVLVAIVRQNVVEMLQSETKVDLKDVKSNQLISRCQNLKSNGGWLPERAFRARKSYYIKKDVGVLWAPPPSANPLQAMSHQDPSQAIGMLKGQMSFVILNGGLAYLINFLFSGFLVAKAPFPLTYRFRSMLQRGIEVPSLDVTYVSSLSWYFFVMLGSNGLLAIINHLRGQDSELITKSTMDLSKPSGQMGMNPAAMIMPGMAGPDMKKVYSQERDNLELVNHRFLLNNIEQRLLQSWKQQQQQR